MDTRQLETLLAIQRSGGFAAAAQAVNLTASAVSQQMRALEVEVGAQLFDRSRRPPVLTAKGAELVRSARAILNIVSETKVDGDWDNLSASIASPSKATAYMNWMTDITNTRLQTSQMFDYTDADNETLDGYNTVDLLTGIRLPVGSVQLGITNLLNTDYETLWSQRADIYYGLTNLTEYKGQGDLQLFRNK